MHAGSESNVEFAAYLLSKEICREIPQFIKIFRWVMFKYNFGSTCSVVMERATYEQTCRLVDTDYLAFCFAFCVSIDHASTVLEIEELVSGANLRFGIPLL